MGCAIIDALQETSGADLSVALTTEASSAVGTPVPGAPNVKFSSNLRAGLDACDVLVDFSSPRAAIDAALAMHGTRCRAFVTGTTGYTATEEAALVAAGDQITLVKSGNFSVGVNVLEALVEQAASRLGPEWDIDILDVHHKHKVDAPSGTALMLGQAAAKGRRADFEAEKILSREGRGAPRRDGQIGFAALRGGGVIGDHDVNIIGDHEMLTLSHRAFDRSIFARGAVKAALWAAGQGKGVYSMRDVLGL